jgi:hypothetical protein
MGSYDGENMMKAGEKNKWTDLYIFEFKNERRSEAKRHFSVNFESISNQIPESWDSGRPSVKLAVCETPDPVSQPTSQT